MKIYLPPSKPTCTHAPQDCWLISAPTPARSRCICWRPAQAVTAMSWPCLARSVAVLGEQARLSLCAQLAGVNTRKARTLAAGLADLAVLAPGEPVRFVHPVVAAPSRTR